jgi:hypothetical protein
MALSFELFMPCGRRVSSSALGSLLSVFLCSLLSSRWCCSSLSSPFALSLGAEKLTVKGFVVGKEAAMASDRGVSGFGIVLSTNWPIGFWGVFRKASCNYYMAPDRKRDMHSGHYPSTGPVIEFSAMMKESKQTNQCAQYVYVCHSVALGVQAKTGFGQVFWHVFHV